MAEEGGLEQVGRDSAGVDRDEGLVAARAVLVDGFGNKLLAGAGFALQQDGRARGRDLGDGVEEAQHGLGFSDDVFEVVALLEGPLELDDLGLGAVARDGGANVGQQLFVVPRLLDEVFSASSDRVHHVADRAEGGDHDDGQVGVHGRDTRQQVDAGLAGQREVEQQQVKLVVRQDVEAFGAILCERDGEALEREEGVEGLADAGLVIDDEQARGSGGGKRWRRCGERCWHWWQSFVQNITRIKGRKTGLVWCCLDRA